MGLAGLEPVESGVRRYLTDRAIDRDRKSSTKKNFTFKNQVSIRVKHNIVLPGGSYTVGFSTP